MERRRGRGGLRCTVCPDTSFQNKGDGEIPVRLAVSLRPAGIQACASNVVPHKGQNVTQPSSCQNPSSGKKRRGQKKGTVGRLEGASRCCASKGKGTRRRRRNYG